MPLTDTAVKNAKPKEKPYKLTDGDGLYLLIKPNGGKYWRFKYLYVGKEKLLALGTYSQRTAALLDRAEINKQENKTLAEIRDALLPKLISGELRIDDAVPVRKEAAG